MSTAELSSLVGRLEAVTSRLEGLAAKGPGGAAGGAARGAPAVDGQPSVSSSSTAQQRDKHSLLCCVVCGCGALLTYSCGLGACNDPLLATFPLSTPTHTLQSPRTCLCRHVIH